MQLPMAIQQRPEHFELEVRTYLNSDFVVAVGELRDRAAPALLGFEQTVHGFGVGAS